MDCCQPCYHGLLSTNSKACSVALCTVSTVVARCRCVSWRWSTVVEGRKWDGGLEIWGGGGGTFHDTNHDPWCMIPWYQLDLPVTAQNSIAVIPTIIYDPSSMYNDDPLGNQRRAESQMFQWSITSKAFRCLLCSWDHVKQAKALEILIWFASYCIL